MIQKLSQKVTLLKSSKSPFKRTEKSFSEIHYNLKNNNTVFDKETQGKLRNYY